MPISEHRDISEYYDIEVELTLLTPEEGGSQIGLYSWTHSHQIFLDDIHWVALYILPDYGTLEPGETGCVFVQFLTPEALIGRLHPNKPFLLKAEYDRTIGKGVIIALLNVEKHAHEAIQQPVKQNDNTFLQESLHHRRRKKKSKNKL